MLTQEPVEGMFQGARFAADHKGRRTVLLAPCLIAASDACSESFTYLDLAPR